MLGAKNPPVCGSVLAKPQIAPSLRAERAVFNHRRRLRQFCFMDVVPLKRADPPEPAGSRKQLFSNGRWRKPGHPDSDEVTSAPRRILIPAAQSRISGRFRSARRSAPALPGIPPTAPGPPATPTTPTHMSNAPANSRNQGDQQRRRRNRGGKNRRGNQSGNPNQQPQAHSREFSPGRDTRGQGQNRRPNQPANTPPRKYAPAKLTWWQKFLKLIGLYKEPARQDRRPARQPDTPAAQQEPRVKSNTRNLRSADAEAGQASTPPRTRDQEGSRRPERRGGDRNSVESPRVYVGNLSYDVTEADLQDLFKGIGGVRNVEIVYNRATHRSKGYGFVEMLHMDEAKRAVEILHDQPFMGRPMTVSGAKSKGLDEREDREDRDERQERMERQERRPRADSPAPAAAAAPAAVVTAESLAASTEIATIIETPVAAETETEAEAAPPPAAPTENTPEATPAAIEPVADVAADKA